VAPRRRACLSVDGTRSVGLAGLIAAEDHPELGRGLPLWSAVRRRSRAATWCRRRLCHLSYLRGR
jgi:hypothetical protein